MIKDVKKQVCAAFFFILVAMIFSGSHTQMALYTSNQHSYFLHGLARGGMGFLEEDWQANTADPFPLFSSLVASTWKHMGEWFFYLYYAILLGIYAFSLTLIVSGVFGFSRSSWAVLLFFLALTFLHSYYFYHLIYHLNRQNPRQYLIWGVAGQYLLGPYLQPSNFGILCLLSIALFIREKPIAAIVSAAAGVYFHSSYLLAVALLTLIYMGIICFRKRDIQQSLNIGLLSLFLVLPLLWYIYVHFGSEAPDIAARAREILVYKRLFNHALPSRWFNSIDCFKIIGILLAIFLARKHPLSLIMLFLFLMSVLLTVIQVLMKNELLALVFPWRISVILVPLSLAIILGFGIKLIYSFLEKRRPILHLGIAGISIVGLLWISAWGIRVTVPEYSRKTGGDWGELVQYIRTNLRSGDACLTPPRLYEFRLATGVPILVDIKTHPYKAREVIEWYRRLKSADKFYHSGDPGEAGKALEEIRSSGHISHVLLQKNKTRFTLPSGKPVFENRTFVLYALKE